MADEKVDEFGQRPLVDDDYFAGGEIQIEVDRTRDWRWGWSVYMRQLNPARTRYREAMGIQWEESRELNYYVGACPVAMTLDEKQAQAIMDGLWRTGVRPTDEVVNDKGTIAAQQANLGDLRRIIFDHPLFTPSIVRRLRTAEDE